MTSTTFTFMSFEEWSVKNSDLALEFEDCLECSGEGSHTCECGDDHDCGFCDGTGKVGGGMAAVYELQKKKDKDLLSFWLDKGW